MTKVVFFKERAFWVVLGLFLLLIVPRMCSSKATKYAYDEQMYHIPEVEKIRGHWPKLDLRHDSLSAISPGYPYFLVTVSQVTGESWAMLRTINLLVSMAILGVLYAWLRVRLSENDSGLVLAPLAFSNFLVKSSGWIVTDNGALLAVVLALMGIFNSRTTTTRLGSSVWAALAIFFRQLYAWLCLPLFLAAVLNPAASRRTKLIDSILVLIPAGVLLLLAITWHGLVPPNEFRQVDVGFSAASIIYLLALGGVFGTVYLFCLKGVQIASIFRHPACLGAALLGLGISLVSATTYDPVAGRWGGYLWNMTQYCPALGGRSLVFIIAVPWGAAVLCRFALLILEWSGLTQGVVWSACLLGWASSFMPNKLAYQRYFEPLLLVFLIFAIGLVQESGPRLIRILPLVLVALLQFVVTLYILWSF